MHVFHDDVKKLAKKNDDFRRVLFTGPHSQLVLMCLQPDEEIGEETHEADQLFYFVTGDGEAVLDGQSKKIVQHDVTLVPGGTLHNIKNTGKKPLRFFTSYSPPQHADGTVHHTKAEADAAERAEREHEREVILAH